MSDRVVLNDNGIFAAYAALVAQAVVPIVLGSFASVKTPHSVKARARQSVGHKYILDPDDDEDDQEEERLGMADSLLFPVFGSITLLSIFLIFKYLGTEWINKILGIYFAFAGVATFQLAFSYIVDGVFARTRLGKLQKYHLRIERGFKQVFHMAFSPATIVLLPVSVIVPALHVYLDKPWYLTNILSFSFAQTSIAMLKLDGFKTGGALLLGLFVYDIFWVFGTPVMVTVAKGLDAPIKVLAPKSMSDTSAGFSMLGLGDIVIPGIFVSLALRYDYASHVARTLKKNPDAVPSKDQTYSKPYFITVMTAYVAGLLATMAVMHTFQKAQPALLYLSPACIGAVVLLAIARGELPAVLKWSDEDEAKEDDLVAEAKRIAAEDASSRPSTPPPPPAAVLADVAAVTPAEADDDWMKLDGGGDDAKESEGKGKRKKSSKKKR